MKITIEPKAMLQINESLEFLSRASIEAANNLLNEINESINSLVAFPYSHSSITNLNIEGRDYRRMIIGNGRYGLIYLVDVEEIRVMLFIDFRRDNKYLLSDLD